jgi:CheY-like chemotaxis protein
MVEAEKNGPRSHPPVPPHAFEVTPDYLAGLVHELRNPLTPIRTAAELLRSVSTDPRQLQAIELISRQVVTLTHMLDDLMDAARGQRGLLALTRRTVDVAELVEQALQAVRPAIDARRQNLFVSLPSEAVQMECDPVRLGQVVQTLLRHATEGTPEGGSIAARVRQEQDELVIEINDDGVGIAAEALPHVFNVFSRASAGSGEQDTGLSLAIVRNLIELHGGSIAVHSEGAGRGSSFAIRLPLRLSHDGHPEASAEQPPGALKILIIDDHRDSVLGWVEYMVRSGHSVLTAESGELGVALAAQFQPDAVIIDIGLPGIDGFEVGRALRAQPETSGALLIAVSGYSLKQFRSLEAYSVFRHYLLKPVSPAGLLQVIAKSVEFAKSAR